MQLFANNADSSLNGAIASDTTVLVLKAGEGDKFPSPINGDFFLVTLFQKVGTTELNHEIVKCTSRAGDNLTIVRAQEGTTAKAFNDGDLVELRITKGTVENFAQPENLATKEPVIAAPSSAPTEKYWRGDKTWRDFFTDVRAATLTGLSTATNAAVAATDTVLTAIGKLQAQVSAKFDKTGGDISGNVNIPSLNGGQLAGMRNKIINGKMEIAQRGANFPAAAFGLYTLDRFASAIIGGAVATVSQQSDVPSSEFQNSLRATITTADTSIAAGEFGLLTQRIEGSSARDLVGRTFTLSFWVRSSKAGIHCVSFGNSGSDRSYVVEYSVISANSWEFKTITVGGGLTTAGTWNWTNGLGVNLRFTLASGSNYQTTQGAWQVGDFIATANQVNCLDTVGNIFAITGVQLEVGSVATPFEHRPYGMELALCQRYYFRVKPGAGQPFAFGANYRSDYARFALNFPVTMRVAPTALEHSGVADHYAIAQSGIGNSTLIVAPLFSVTTQNLATFSAQVASGLTVFNPSTLSAEATNGAEAFLAWSAEL